MKICAFQCDHCAVVRVVGQWLPNCYPHEFQVRDLPAPWVYGTKGRIYCSAQHMGASLDTPGVVSGSDFY